MTPAAPPAVVALGSNLGDRLAHLRLAVRVLQARAVSPVYATDPVGPPGQGEYLNAVVLVDGDAAQVWERAQAAEAAAGRTREARWGPRTLDVDLVVAQGAVAGLTLPHPRAAERAFVLVPWLDLQPDAELPGHGRVDALLAALDRTGVRRTDLVLA